jgi:putative ABC transport system permease protein
VGLGLQSYALTTCGLRHIPQRVSSSLVVVVGIAGVVAVLIPVLAMYIGFRATIKGDGRADRAIILAREATSEDDSGLSRDTVADIVSVAQARRDASGQAMVSAEVVLAAPASRKRDHSDVNVTLRGVGAQYFAMRPELRLVAGRMFRSGTREVLVGVAAQSQFEALQIGDKVPLEDGDWTVVGAFAGGNGERESELVADAQTLASAYKLNSFNSVALWLESPSEVATLTRTLVSDARLSVSVYSEPKYLEKASEPINRTLRLVTYGIGSIMALGALFAALNSMYSAVASRATEMATLRAIGFSAAAVAVAVLAEAGLLALAGAAIGAGLSYAAFHRLTISTLGGALFDSQLVYSLKMTPSLVASVIALACTLGLAGALLPAVRAATANLAGALHET